MGLNLGSRPAGSSALEVASKLLEQAASDVDAGTQDMGLEEYVLSTIKLNVCSTIHIQWVNGGVQVDATYPTEKKVVDFPGVTGEDYMDLLQRAFGIDPDEKDNCSRSCLIDGVQARVFCYMQPFVMHPLTIISTTKQPPSKLDNCLASDELLSDILHSNFIVVGGSGSGKTYLLNYMLSHFIGDDEEICMIEEFSELVNPNSITKRIIVPPPKSNEKSKLRFIVEQSNLGRFDAIYVGEIKGGEAWPFVLNMASGTRGACTMHGDTAEHALARLRALCQIEMPDGDVVNEFIAKSLRYIIVMHKHRIVEIKRLTGTVMKNNFSMEPVVVADGFGDKGMQGRSVNMQACGSGHAPIRPR